MSWLFLMDEAVVVAIEALDTRHTSSCNDELRRGFDPAGGGKY